MDVDVLILVAKSVLAAVLLVAGGSKLADLASFASTVRLFAPRSVPRSLIRCLVFAIAFSELGLGAVSLSFPSIEWLNLAVLATGAGFLAVSITGYILYRGRSCRCFGALSQRDFDATGIIRSMVIVLLAAAATLRVPQADLKLNILDHILLLCAAVLLALSARSGATALAVSREARPEAPPVLAHQ